MSASVRGRAAAIVFMPAFLSDGLRPDYRNTTGCRSARAVTHYFEAEIADQFDTVLHVDETRAGEPPDRTREAGELPETYPLVAREPRSGRSAATRRGGSPRRTAPTRH